MLAKINTLDPIVMSSFTAIPTQDLFSSCLPANLHLVVCGDARLPTRHRDLLGVRCCAGRCCQEMQSPLSIPGGATVLGALEMGVRHGTLPQPCHQALQTAPPSPTEM